jgi:Fe-S cluster assembly protein SufD
MLTQSLDQFAVEYENAARARGAEPPWLTTARRHALERFQSLGFPTTRDEEWRFTSVSPIAECSFARPLDGRTSFGRSDLAPFRWPLAGAHEIVFVNGRYAAGLSDVGTLPPKVRIESLASALVSAPDKVEPYLTRLADGERHAFTALNAALFEDGAFIWIPAHTVLDAPIHVLFVSSPAERARDARATMTHPRVVVAIGEDSQASIVESYAGPDGGSYLTNTVTEVVLGQSAVLDHYKLQREGVRSFHMAAMHARAARSANLRAHAISLGGSLVRNEVTVVLDGEGVECTLNGLYLADDRRLVDNHTTIDHAKPHCGSREIYKGILADAARAVFNGKIIVRPDAQKTDARQTNKALLLSEDALINTKPQLEIFANDVKCTHGAAVGQMDDEAIFYLRSRGLSESEARHFLLRAFAGDVLNRMPLEPLRTAVEEVLVRQLPSYAERA